MRPILPSRPRLTLVAAAALVLSGLHGLAGAQSLQELYEGARVFDATYLAARASFESAEYRVAQSDALMRPSVAATAGASTSQTDTPTTGGLKGTNSVSGALNGRYPLFNRANGVTI